MRWAGEEANGVVKEVITHVVGAFVTASVTVTRRPLYHHQKQENTLSVLTVDTRRSMKTWQKLVPDKELRAQID